jgi:hypothetical protein
MAEPAKGAIQIGHLNLRMPGGSAEAAHRVADGIGQGLAQKVPAGMRRHIGALSVRVQVPAGATEAEMSDSVAAAIVKAMRKARS